MSVTRDADIHGPEAWAAALVAAGWREVRLNVWERPDGALFRGPYGAWCALHTVESLQSADAVDPHAADPGKPSTRV